MISEAIQQDGWWGKEEKSDKCDQMNTDFFVQGREYMCMALCCDSGKCIASILTIKYFMNHLLEEVGCRELKDY